MDLQPTLHGELVKLRPLQGSDHDRLYAVASDPLIWEQHPAKERAEPEGFRRFFDEALASGGALLATDANTGDVIGSSRYFGYDAGTRDVEIGWTFLARKYWGGRYNGEMKRLMLDHAFRFVDSVVFLIAPTDLRSQRAVEKIGAVREGTMRRGERDNVVYRLHRSDLSSRRHPRVPARVEALMNIALASPKPAASIEDGLARIGKLTRDAAGKGARIVCFPEAYLPGLRGQDFAVCEWSDEIQARVLSEVAALARTCSIAVVLSLERLMPDGSQISAVVIDATGRVVGWQSKNQLDPSEDQSYVPGRTRRVFEIEGLRFGIVTCHEGWRYPETVRWAAVRGATVVFHPQHTGSNRARAIPTEWGSAGGAYYEKAMLCRSRENTIYFASVNYALDAPEAATSLINPAGECQAWLPYGQQGVLVQPIDVSLATGLLARRYAPDRYMEDTDHQSGDCPT